MGIRITIGKSKWGYPCGIDRMRKYIMGVRLDDYLQITCRSIDIHEHGYNNWGKALISYGRVVI
jgi:hypothetical protein